MQTIISPLRAELQQKADEKLRISGQRYFKEEITMYGIKTIDVRLIGERYFEMIRQQPKNKIFELCENLWQSGFIEETFIACNWSYAIRKKYEPADFNIFAKWVEKYVNNWASCDTLCNHTIGTFIEMYPEFISKLKEWAQSQNRWVKRASAVTLILPARRGKFLNDIFEIADLMLIDKDDMVQKGYGWMLKAASQAHQKEVFDYVVKNKAIMPRTALRYAIEKMPKELKTVAMAK